MTTRISIIFGTRPEAIKLCPLIQALKEHPYFTPHVCLTGQHVELIEPILEAFEIEPDVNLQLMQPNQTLDSLTAKAITGCHQYLEEANSEMVIVQGDTTTVFAAALAAFYHQIPVAHVEAGLRTWNNRSPFPEEINRVLTSRLAAHHFTPTDQATRNLLKEGVSPDQIYETGNTVIDALLQAVEIVRINPPQIPGLETEALESGRRRVLVTAHRRENFGDGFQSLCEGIRGLALRYPNVDFVYPVHLNPNVRKPVFRLLNDFSNIKLIEPLSYFPFVALMDRSDIVLTDSGGVQEEAPSLGKPVLVMRDTTERPEAISMGTVRLVGTSTQSIISHVSELLEDPAAYEKMSKSVNPYGDGHAVNRIVGFLEKIFEEKTIALPLRRAA